MRNKLRNSGFAAALLAAGALALAACQPRGDGDAAPEEAGAPSNEEREAALAAEQLAALGGPGDAAQRALYAGEFQAVGALGDVGAGEGAWELRLLEDYALFSRPGLGEDGGLVGGRDVRERGMRVTAGPLTITLLAEACTLPNGVEQPYTAHVLFEGVAYQGCARSGVSSEARPTWASVLPELIAPIDACLARASARPARVTFAGAIDDGMVAVRLREADGGRAECIVDAAGQTVAVYEPLSDLDRRGGEGDPDFVRGGAQPGGRCVSEALGREGETLGWLIARSC